MPLRNAHSQSVSRHDSEPALSATLWPGPTLVASISTLLLLCFGWGPGGAVASTDAAARTLVLSVKGDRVSATIAQAPLREVLAELARQVPLRLSITGPVAEERVSVSFRHLPLAEGIERILAGRSYALIYASPQAASGVVGRVRIVEIVLLPREGLPANAAPSGPLATERAQAPGEAVSPPRPAGGAPSVPEDLPVDWLRHQSRDAANPAERVAALEALTERSESQEVLPTLTAALADPDATVRAAALALIKDTGDAIPLAPVTEVAVADASPKLRMQALALLAKRAKAEAADPLTRALKDPDPQVRERARALLDKLGIPVAGADASGSDETPSEGERR